MDGFYNQPWRNRYFNSDLFNIISDENYVLYLPELTSDENSDLTESVMDIKPLSDSIGLILTNKQLFGIDMQSGQIVMQMDLSKDTEMPFHLWINKTEF